MKKELMEQLKQGLRIDKNDLDNEIAAQSEAFFRVAEETARAISRRDEAKSDMEEQFSLAASRFRKKNVGGSASGKDRVTEGQIKEAANKDDDYVASVDAFLAAKREADQLQAMREAYDMRGKMLRELAQLYIAGYFQLTAVGAKTQRRMDRAAGQEAREIMGRDRLSRRPR